MAPSPEPFDPTVFARLARLELSSEERSRYAREFETLLQYFGAIAKVDTSGVEPMVYPIDHENRMREDSSRDSGARAAILGNAPGAPAGPPPADGAFFRVPKVIES